MTEQPSSKGLTWDELFRWQEEHPAEDLFACARFNEEVHLCKYLGGAWVGTRCGLAGPAKLFALVFKLPIQAVDCERCKELARLQEDPQYYGWLKLALQCEPLDSKLIRILSDLGWYKAVPFIRADADAERASRAREMEGK